MRLCCWPRSDLDEGLLADERARQLAASGIEDVLRGCASLRECDLPAESRRLVIELRRGASQLQGLVAEARAAVVLPWARPLPEDQVDFERRLRHTCGGRLLRALICVAAAGVHAEEWAMGTLYISERGLLFEGGGGLLEDGETLKTGLVLWADVVGVEDRGLGRAASPVLAPRPQPAPHAPQELALLLREGLPVPALQIQLALASDREWLVRVWRACTGEGGVQQLRFRESMLEGADAGASGEAYPQASPGLNRALEALSQEAPGKEPLYQGLIPAPANMAFVRQLLEVDDWIVGPFFEGEPNLAHDIQAEPWVVSSRASRTFSRRMRSIMPMPPDVPRPVASLMGMPAESNSTAIFTLRVSDEEIFLSSQAIMHDVLFSDRLRVQELHSWRLAPGGGVEYRKWADIIYLKSMPFGFGVAKGWLEGKTRERSRLGGPAMLRLFAESLAGGHVSAAQAPARGGASPAFSRSVALLWREGSAGSPLPAAEPTFAERIAGLSLAQVKSALEPDACVLSEWWSAAPLSSYDLVSDPWAPAPQAAEGVATVRRIRCLMPMPEDVPRAVAAVVGVPKVSAATVMFALQVLDDGEVRLTSQAAMHDVMFSERARVQERHSFRAHVDGGVEYRKWCDVVFLEPLPFGFGVARAFMVKSATDRSKASGPSLVRILSEQP